MARLREHLVCGFQNLTFFQLRINKMWKTSEDGETKYIGHDYSTHESVFLNWVGPHLIGAGIQWPASFYVSKRLTDGHHTYRCTVGFVSVAFIYHPKYLPDGKRNAFHR